ncbi:hypothetical protein KJ359_007379 [Pestalotiopsis sp. 9143b]|nr:hypothetical protein KJ359_007379 [Pestalotiopsis sp. 9143b]
MEAAKDKMPDDDLARLVSLVTKLEALKPLLMSFTLCSAEFKPQMAALENPQITADGLNKVLEDEVAPLLTHEAHLKKLLEVVRLAVSRQSPSSGPLSAQSSPAAKASEEFQNTMTDFTGRHMGSRRDGLNLFEDLTHVLDKMDAVYKVVVRGESIPES